MRDIVFYSDYRKYLRDFVDFKKKTSYVSNRWFAQKVGINSSSWLTSVLQGKKGVSEKIAERISKVLKLSRSEAEYFVTLVQFNQAKDSADRNLFYQQLLLFRKSKKVKHVEHDQYEFYATWYHSVVRSLIGMYDFKDDITEISRMIRPPVSDTQVRKSVDLLLKLGLIKKDENGFLRLSSETISSGKECKSLGVANYQQETMKMAWEARDRFPAQSRDIATLTVGVSENGVKILKEELAAFRKKSPE